VVLENLLLNVGETVERSHGQCPPCSFSLVELQASHRQRKHLRLAPWRKSFAYGSPMLRVEAPKSEIGCHLAFYGRRKPRTKARTTIMLANNKRIRPHRRHAKELDGGEAFIHDSRHGFTPIGDGDTEAFGEEFIAGATSNDAIGEVARDETYAEELGGVMPDLFDIDETEH